VSGCIASRRLRKHESHTRGARGVRPRRFRRVPLPLLGSHSPPRHRERPGPDWLGLHLPWGDRVDRRLSRRSSPSFTHPDSPVPSGAHGADGARPSTGPQGSHSPRSGTRTTRGAVGNPSRVERTHPPALLAAVSAETGASLFVLVRVLPSRCRGRPVLSGYQVSARQPVSFLPSYSVVSHGEPTAHPVPFPFDAFRERELWS
jgi:hypothetical protein